VILRARQFEFTFPQPALVMGIINVTPDSFSDGGRFWDADAAVAHGLELAQKGAGILDVGGESTRPGAVPVGEDEELRRVIPVIERLASQVRVPISVDTSKVSVARASLAAGASIVNDVGANREEDQMWQVVAEAQAGYICMHMQGQPQTMQAAPTYIDVRHEVQEFFLDRLRRLSGCGVGRDQVILDPGIGFGKSLDHNLQLLGAAAEFTSLGRPLVIGVSRKSFMGNLLGVGVEARLPCSLACACLAVEAGVQLIRAHDVTETVQAIRMTEAILVKRRTACGKS
jgi:dihydropteroate synthase